MVNWLASFIPAAYTAVGSMGDVSAFEGLTWDSLVVDPLSSFVADLLKFLPDLLVALCILFFGWVVAKIVQLIVSAFLDSIGFDKFAKKIGIAELVTGEDKDITPHRWFGLLGFWITISVSLVMIFGRLRLRIASVQLDQLLYFFFTVLSSFIILMLGMILSFIASRIVGAIANNLKMKQVRAVSEITRWAILIFTFIACLIHIGFPPNIMLIAVGIAYVSICIAFVISFGAGGIVWASKFLDRTFTKDR